MSYDIEIHSLIRRFADEQIIDPETKALLDLDLAEEEQLAAIRTYASLNEIQDFEELLDWDCYDDASFSQRFGIDEQTIRRWRSEGMTAWERDMVIYLLCQAEIENDRIHFCTACGRMFRAYVADDCRCPECQAEQIAQSVVALFSAKNG